MADLAVVGDAEAVARQLRSYTDAGATEIWAVPFPVATDGRAVARTRRALAELATELATEVDPESTPGSSPRSTPRSTPGPRRTHRPAAQVPRDLPAVRARARRRRVRDRGRGRAAAARWAEPGGPRAPLVLTEQGLVPDDAAARLFAVLLDARRTPVEDFGYDPAFGEAYNGRERRFARLIGKDAGWLHVARTRREAVRVALRLRLRLDVLDLVEAGAAFALAVAGQADAHAETYLADQTYLQHAQPSTFGHYLLAFADPVLRDVERLRRELDWVNRSPGGVGSVNGGRLPYDRSRVAELLAFDGVIEHTRDAMWQTDGYRAAVAAATSLVTTLSKLAEDLEIWAGDEYGWVELADGHSRRQRDDAAEAQPVRLVDGPRRGRRAHRPAHRAARGGEDAVRPQRRHDLRLRRGAPRPRPRGEGGPPHGRRRRRARRGRCRHATRARPVFHAGDRSGGVRHAGVRGRLPDRVRGRRRGGPPGRPGRAHRAGHRRGHARRRRRPPRGTCPGSDRLGSLPAFWTPSRSSPPGRASAVPRRTSSARWPPGAATAHSTWPPRPPNAAPDSRPPSRRSSRSPSSAPPTSPSFPRTHQPRRVETSGHPRPAPEPRRVEPAHRGEPVRPGLRAHPQSGRVTRTRCTTRSSSGAVPAGGSAPRT